MSIYSFEEDLVRSLLGFVPQNKDLGEFYEQLCTILTIEWPETITETQSGKILTATLKFLFGVTGTFVYNMHRNRRRQFKSWYVNLKVEVNEPGSDSRRGALLVVKEVLWLLDEHKELEQLVYL